ncbi:transposase [Sphingobium sp. EP60837]|uniref:transposase n=1 Tax=Sphingobium sp. EP60837 TaxID=1855519 RepID=UPI0008357B24|nr:transposase [Sphingobium sp. EP60837]
MGEAIASLLSVRTELMEQIKEMDRRMRIIASQSQACEILMSIPGVGVQTSVAFASAIDDAGRFRQSRNARGYFDLVPRRYSTTELRLGQCEQIRETLKGTTPLSSANYRSSP